MPDLPKIQRRSVDEPAKYRTFQVRAKAPDSLDEKARTVDAVLATENPVPMIDWDEFEMVPEILLMSGAEIPTGERMPLCNSHRTRDISDILGSCTKVRVAGTEMLSVLEFSEDEDGEKALTKVRGGHLRDLSIGYRVHERVKAKDGESVVIDGRTFKGPVNIATRWSVFEGSLCPIGADYAAKVREAMTNGKHGATRAGNQEGGKTMPDLNPTPVSSPVAPPPAPAITQEQADQKAKEAARIATEQEAERQNAIRTMCRKFEVGQELEDELTRAGVTVEQANKRMLDHLAKSRAAIPTAPQRPNVEGGRTDDEKFRARVAHGLIMRDRPTKLEKPEPGHEEFVNKPLLRIAEDILARHGAKGVSSLSADAIASMILGNKRAGGVRPIIAATADFENICMDAINISLQSAYVEAPHIWDMIANKRYFANFQPAHVVKLSEAPNLEKIEESGEYTHAKFSDQAETYSVYSWGKFWSITRQALMNDSRTAFERIPRLFGNAAQRKIEQLVIALLTENGTMADGKAIFHADHNNLLSGAAFSQATVAALKAAIRKQKGFGENTAPISAVMRYCLVPVALEFANEIACASAQSPTTSYGANAVNPIQRAGIIPISSPILDASSEIIHYGIADKSQQEGLEVGLLTGGDAPVVEIGEQMNVDGRVIHVRHDIGAACIDHRGVARHAGA